MLHSKLKDKYAIVTGGGGGTGQQVASRLTALGVKVEIWGRTPASLQQVVDNNHAVKLAVIDITNSNDISSRVNELVSIGQKIDLVVHCAGIWTEGDIVEVNVDSITRHLDAIVLGSVLVARAAVHLMTPYGGHYLQIAAASAKAGFIDSALNTLAKRAQDGLHEGLLRELRGTEIKVTTVYPDSISSPDDPAVVSGQASTYADIAEVIAFALTAPDSVDVEEIVVTARRSGRWQ